MEVRLSFTLNAAAQRGVAGGQEWRQSTSDGNDPVPTPKRKMVAKKIGVVYSDPGLTGMSQSLGRGMRCPSVGWSVVLGRLSRDRSSAPTFGPESADTLRAA
jgi:hypothetical protein